MTGQQIGKVAAPGDLAVGETAAAADPGQIAGADALLQVVAADDGGQAVVEAVLELRIHVVAIGRVV